MEQLTLNCKIITPLFLGSANPAIAELRPPSIKGALRFWWRAIHPEKDWEKLLELENKIFGSANEEFGRSKFSISISNMPEPKGKYNGFKEECCEEGLVQVEGKTFKIHILDYLAYGCKENSSFYKPGQEFKLRLSFSPSLTSKQIESITDALHALSLFGNVGAKSRNGFGKIWIEGLPEPTTDIKKCLLEGAQTAYLTGSDKAALFQTLEDYEDWDLALSEIGKIYRTARTTIEDGGNNGRHDTRKRAYLAQPVNEDKSWNGLKANFKFNRHAKAIFLSVIPAAGMYFGQILIVPYLFAKDHDNSENVPKKVRDELSIHQGNYNTSHDKFYDSLKDREEEGLLTEIKLEKMKNQ